jgi:hypothetical protein
MIESRLKSVQQKEEATRKSEYVKPVVVGGFSVHPW